MKVKFKILMTLLIAGSAFITNEAKSQSKSPIHIGIKGGGNFSDLSLSETIIDSKNSLGYHAGVFTRLDISRLYVQGELLYSQKTSKIEKGSLGATKVKWNSIEVPVMVGFHLLKSEKATFRIFGGGVYSYVVNDKATLLNQVSQSFQKFDKSNVGFQAGVGADIGRLTLDLKYKGALTNISSDFKARPTSIQASVGIMLF